MTIQELFTSIELSQWVLILTTLFLGTIALITPWISEIAKRNIYKPKITVKFENSPPYCLRTFWFLGDHTTKEPVFYFRLRVINEGKAQIRKCETILKGISIQDASGTMREWENFSEVNLHWAGLFTQEQFVDINPNRGYYCDIGHISYNYRNETEQNLFSDFPNHSPQGFRFLFDITPGFPLSQPNCLGEGVYKIDIDILSENAPLQSLSYKISWSGKWQNEEKDMFREIVIEPI